MKWETLGDFEFLVLFSRTAQEPNTVYVIFVLNVNLAFFADKTCTSAITA